MDFWSTMMALGPFVIFFAVIAISCREDIPRVFKILKGA